MSVFYTKVLTAEEIVRTFVPRKGRTMNVETKVADVTIEDNGTVTIDDAVETGEPVEIFVQAKEDFEGASPEHR